MGLQPRSSINFLLLQYKAIPISVIRQHFSYQNWFGIFLQTTGSELPEVMSFLVFHH